MKNPIQITLSGISDHVPIDDVLALKKAYPNVEIGVLASPGLMGHARHPSIEYLEQLCSYPELDLSLHLCRGYMKELFLKKNPAYYDLRAFWPHFKRIQFNYYTFFTNDSIPPRTYANKAKALLEMCFMPYFAGKELIFPISPFSRRFIDEFLLPVIDDYNASLFFDGSHGQGRSPEKWEAPLKQRIKPGYAGAHTPENIQERLAQIVPLLPPGYPFWIDIESGIMADGHKNDPALDHWEMKTVWDFCENVMQFMHLTQ